MTELTYQGYEKNISTINETVHLCDDHLIYVDPNVDYSVFVPCLKNQSYASSQISSY